MTGPDPALHQYQPGADLHETLAMLAGDDPRLAQVAQVLALRDRQESERVPDEGDGPGVQEDLDRALAREKDLREELLALQRNAEEVLEEAKRTRDALEIAMSNCRRREDVIERAADGLGACPACLGMEEFGDCELCRNRARPGTRPPDPEEFRFLVMPAVRAYAYTRSLNRGDHPSHRRTES